MSKTEEIMYCPNCKRNVLATRENFRVGLAIILAIFTGGIGLLIYLAIYLDKPRVYCIHCRTECEIRQTEEQRTTNYTYPSSTYQVVSQAPQKQLMIVPVEKKNIVETKTTFCHNCGTELSDRAGQYCYLCGASIE